MDRRQTTRDADADRLVVLGRVGPPQGVRGWLKLHSYTEPREELLRYRDCFLGRDGEWRVARIAEARRHGRTLIARFDDVHDREAARAHVGTEIGVPRGALPDPGAGHYYWADLEGLEVRHRDGRSLGRVSHLVATGAHDVLVVEGERETLIPFVMDKVILDVDLAGKVIEVDWEWD